MQDKAKLFVCVKNGWAMSFTPIGWAGWKALGWWTLSLLLITAIFVAFIAKDPSPAIEAVLTVAFLTSLGLWTWAMIRWMLPRSDVIAAKDIQAYQEDRARRGGRRRP
jgi:hypothetical protein